MVCVMPSAPGVPRARKSRSPLNTMVGLMSCWTRFPVAGLADRICVMYSGRIVEAGPTDDVLDRPVHPYTRGLIGSIPSHNERGRRLAQIPGMAPALLHLPAGCAFRPRCTIAGDACRRAPGVSEPIPGRLIRCFHPREGGGS